MSSLSDWEQRLGPLDERLFDDPHDFDVDAVMLEFLDDGVDEGVKRLDANADIVEGATRVVIDGYYDGFNTSLQTFGQVNDRFEASKKQVRELRASVAETRSLLTQQSERIREIDFLRAHCKHALAAVRSMACGGVETRRPTPYVAAQCAQALDGQ